MLGFFLRDFSFLFDVGIYELGFFDLFIEEVEMVDDVKMYIIS